MTTHPNQHFGVQNEDGYRLEIFAAAQPERFLISTPTAPGHRMFISNDQAPAVALAILRAAGVNPSGRTEPDTWQECVATAAGHLDDAFLIADGGNARVAAEAALDAEALTLARAWFNTPDADWADLAAIRAGVLPQAIRAAEAARRIHEDTK